MLTSLNGLVTLIISNAPPVAVDDQGVGFVTPEDSALATSSVLMNDIDSNSDSLAVLSYDAGDLLGTLIDNGDGTFDYDPPGEFAHLLPGETAYLRGERWGANRYRHDDAHNPRYR